MMLRKNNDETSIWISNTDLMSGLLVLFLFIAIAMSQASKASEQKLKEIAGENIQAEAAITSLLDNSFSPSEKEMYGINYNGPGTAWFKDNSGTFDVGSAELSYEFKQKLDDFLPKYIKAIYSQKEYAQEIRIEGHTSSEWSGQNTSVTEAYFKNMALSQERTRAILDYAFTIPELYEYHDFMREKITANGLSSSHLIYDKNGKEDKMASRRIEFKVVGNNQKLIDAAKKAGGYVVK